MLKTTDIFNRPEGEAFDLTQGIDIVDFFNAGVASPSNQLEQGFEQMEFSSKVKAEDNTATDDLLQTRQKTESLGDIFTTPAESEKQFGFQKSNEIELGDFSTPKDDSDAEVDVPTVKVDGSAHKNRADIPFKKGGPTAAIRYNNPAAAYPRPSDNKYGLEGYGVLKAGKQGTHKIGRFPTPVHGGAANFDLFASKYKGMTMYDAVAKWRGNKARGEKVVVPKGYNPKQKIDSKFLEDPNRAVDFFKKMAVHESAGKQGLSSNEWKEAWKMWKAGGSKNYEKLKS